LTPISSRDRVTSIIQSEGAWTPAGKMTGQFSEAQPAFEAGSAKALVIDFRNLIQFDSDLEKQATLHRLLIEEIDKLAKNREQHEESECLIEKGRERIGNGRDRVERQNKISPAGRDNRDEHRTLELMESMRQLFVNFHNRLQRVYPYAVELQGRVVGVCATLDEAKRRAEQFANANPQAVISVVDAAQLSSESFSLNLP
jgi:hypothetical protein